ncbi:BTAD domain-containing putative transcriptional regulator [Paractinoplanes ferrugineus]|uniref:SARP family transcriptional regulator n=1 Tax=Paractinoplanes ferrugineus TaxID=113564 RepID=A0A919JD29_9ACTN|nr:BTAD domain-containing putative transcriptional regulator [Actinoplanes ferrugineus]GIE14946.1 SARP family transcriptional regulator [Actinoplanes ferrugineus]
MDIAVLGPVELRAGAEVVPVAGARLRTLLLLLALDVNRVVTAERLIDGVWGDEPPQAAGNALQALVSRLRRVSPELVVQAAPNGYRLVLEPRNIDSVRFTELARVDPGEALALWRGDLDFPDVARADARRLEELRLTAQRRHLEEQIGRSDVVPELEGLAAAHPFDQPLAVLLMRALAEQGNPGRALEIFEAMRRRLATQLGTDPAPELAELHLGLLRAAPANPRGNLPAEVSSFVGRDTDVREVCALLAGHRLVTLLGPGGNGKTRLSVEVGARLAGEVWRVELAPVTDPAEVPRAVLTALRLSGQMSTGRLTGPGETLPPLARLAESLAGREMVLILDNCEHLIAAAAELADTLLRAAPGLRLLTTSREPLAIAGERLFAVEPLALPPVGAAATTASAFPAVRLLLDRAATLTLDERTVEPVIRICRALDGMPLAIELAAARLRTLPVAVLADRLADRFRLLTGGSRTALPRHQTLRAVVDWSWDLLDAGERRLWRRFAVFHGGADVAAVEQVCVADLDLLGALVDKSLLVLGSDGRYRMLETIREYGLARLAEAGEAESQRRALAEWLLALAETAEPKLRSAEQLEWLRRVTDEHDNFHASVRAAVDAGDRATAAALVARLGWYWWLRGHRIEGALLAAAVSEMPGPMPDIAGGVSGLAGAVDREDLALVHTFAAINGLEGALPIDAVQRHLLAAEAHGAGPAATHPALRLLKPLAAIFDNPDPDAGFRAVEPLFEDPDPWCRATAKMIVAHLRLNFGQRGPAAIADMRDALDGFRTVGERWGIGFTLSALGDLVCAQGDFVQGIQLQREAIALVREVGIREDLPQLEVKLAHQLYLSGERDEARRVLNRSAEMAEEIGLPEVLASVQYGYATIARLEGDLETARRMIGRSADMMGNPAFAPQFGAMTRSTQGLIEAAAGNLERARRCQHEAVRIAVDSRDAPVIAMTLVGLADLALRESDPARAAFLLGAADAVRGSRDRTVPDTDRITFEARAALGDAGFEHEYDRAASTTGAEVPSLLETAPPPRTATGSGAG